MTDRPDSVPALAPIAVVGRDDPRFPLGDYHLELHPDDEESLDALIAHDDVADAHAIVRWRTGTGRWRLVEHRVRERRRDGVTVLSRLDVTAREQAREREGRAEAYWRTVLRNGHESIAVVEPLGLTITHANDRLSELLGYPPGSLVGSRAFWHVDRRDLAAVRTMTTEWAGSAGTRVSEFRLRSRNGDAVWVETVLSDAREDPAVGAYVLNLREIGDRKLAEEQLRSSEQLFRILVHHLADGAIVVDDEARIAFVSERAAEALGAEVDELRGTVVPLRETDDGLELGGVAPVGRRPPLYRLPTEVLGPKGRWYHLAGHDLSDDPVVSGWILVLRDITDSRVRVARLRREVEEDSLTGLLNRRGLESRVATHLAKGRTVGVGFLDLDGFKIVNDTHGHSSGDALLCAVAARLRRCVRPGDEVARFGGDEFVVAFVDLPSESELVEMTNRVLDAVAGSYATDHGTVEVGVSAGWSVALPGTDVQEALRRADFRMYEQKRRLRS
jgi:diguanylate cyclase (GGDEF)-like protein/PAS domain S-box-containing protein